jgi:glutamate decarboxylase
MSTPQSQEMIALMRQEHLDPLAYGACRLVRERVGFFLFLRRAFTRPRPLSSPPPPLSLTSIPSSRPPTHLHPLITPVSSLFSLTLTHNKQQEDTLSEDTFPAGPTPPRHVKAYLDSLRALDANPQLNLASFVTTSVEPECLDVMAAALRVNQIDAEEYASTCAIHERCVRQLADLFRVPKGDGQAPCGFSTVGSSEAIQLSLLAAKRRWRSARAANGLPAATPNLVAPSTVHVCHEKAAVYFDVELRTVPVTKRENGMLRVDLNEFMSRVDENTILAVAVLGSTYTGHFDDVGALDKAVGAWNDTRRPAGSPPLGIHVDAASGGFVAPFAFPDFAFDFTACPNVVSLNASGHKFGQVLAGIGWCLCALCFGFFGVERERG